MAKTISEAPESNAGDNFHILWAMRKSLELLNVKETALKAISIEGPNFKEGNTLDELGDKLLAIDLAEYYNGETFENADRIVFSQLKYSTRRANENYTISNLCYGEKSIIKKLAKVYKTYLEAYGRDELIEKLTIKLVSNREVNNPFIQSLKKIQTHISSTKSILKKHQLTKKFPNDKKFLDVLFDASKLKSSEFEGFITTLNFSDCGTASRFGLQEELTKSIAEVDNYETRIQFNNLYMLIDSLTMPESRENNSITIRTILAQFGINDLQSLAPAPNLISIPKHFVKRDQLNEVTDFLASQKTGLFCLHGGGGVGKSTFSHLISKHSSLKDSVITYDCYGNGSYLDDRGIRHTNKTAFKQLSNQLALKFGAPLLLSNNLAKYEWISEFNKRIGISIDILTKSNPEAVLTIIIDACDNSVTAAKQKNDDCFVHGICSMENIPDNCRLILTSRTSRIDSLNLPKHALKIEIKAFSLNETTKHLVNKKILFSKKEVSQFHKLTNQNPRVQSYALEQYQTKEELFQFLMPYGKNITTLIEGQIEEAKKKIGDTSEVKVLLQSIINLPRPIPVEIVARIGNQDADMVRDFCQDSSTGFVLENDLISFRDEDFENFLRVKYKETPEIYSRIADDFLAKHKEESYSAINLGIALFNSKRFEELSNLVLSEEPAESIEDIIERRKAVVLRTQLALSSCQKSEDHEMFMKLLFLCAKANKTDNSRYELLSSNIELANEFCDFHSLKGLFQKITSNYSNGAAHWECAQVFAHDSRYHNYAQSHLELASNWLRERQNKTYEDRRHEYPLEARDIAFGMDAIYRVEGLSKAEEWLRRCSKPFAYNVVRIFLNGLGESDIDLLLVLIEKEYRLDVSIYAALRLFDLEPFNQTDISDLIRRINVILGKRINLKGPIISKIIDLCEVHYRKTKSKKDVLQVVEQLSIPLLTRDLSFWSLEYENERTWDLDNLLKQKCLISTLTSKELKTESIIPQIQDDADQEKINQHKSELEKLKNLYEKLIPFYLLRSKIVLQEPLVHIIESLGEAIVGLTGNFSYMHSRHDSGKMVLFIIDSISDSLTFVANKQKFLLKLAELRNAEGIGKRSFLLKLAEISCRYPETHEFSLSQLSDVDKHLSDAQISATELMDEYIDCAKVAISIDRDEAEEYFNKAVESASQIDWDVTVQLEALSSISDNLGNQSIQSEVTNGLIHYVEECNTRLSNYDKFPWRTGLSLIKNLNKNLYLGLLCRWDYLQNIDLLHHWTDVLLEDLKSGELTNEQAFGLSALYIYDYSKNELPLSIISSSNTKETTKRKVSDYLIKDIQTIYPLEVRQSTIERVYPLIETNVSSYSQAQNEFHKYSNYLSQLYPPTPIREDIFDNGRNKKEEMVVELALSVDHTNPIEINETLIKFQLESEFNNNREIETFLDRLLDRSSVKDCVEHLNAYIQISNKIVSDYAFKRGLTNGLNKWGHLQKISKWKRSSFDTVIQRYFSEGSKDLRSSYVHVSYLEDLMVLFDKTNRDLALCIKQIITSSPEKFTTEAIYRMMEIFRYLLDENQTLEFFNWFDAEHVQTKDASLGRIESLDKTSQYALALKYCLAHPYKSIRWRAIHSIRRLINLGDHEILATLLNDHNEENNVFGIEGTHFFNCSAKLWLFVAISRISFERPSALLKFKDILLKEALKSNEAHAMIRWYAKQACLELSRNHAEAFTGEEINKLNHVLVPNAKIEVNSSERARKSTAIKPKGRDGETFTFDSLDTIPYWFDGLARRFNLTSSEVESRAEYYLSNNLGLIGNLKYENDFINSLIGERSYHLTSNRHGSIPSVENHRRYLEYHSMFFVANDLIESLPAVSTDEWESWDSWLEQWKITACNEWLYDRREATPQQEIFWRFSEDDKPSEGWLESLNIENYHAKIEWGDYWVVGGNYTRYSSSDYETVGFNSALVNPDRAQSLMRALHLSDRAGDYKLPDENEEDFEYEQENGFELKGWTVTEFTEGYSEEKEDAYALGLNPNKTIFGDIFQKWLDVNITGLSDIQSPVKIETWSDVDETENHKSGFGTIGYRLLIHKSILTRFLRVSGYSLILECEMTRHLKYHRKKDRYSPRKAQIYNIDSNGEVETIQ